MIRASIALVGAMAVLSVGLATTAFGQSASPTTLKGTVGPGFTISLTKGGHKVKTLKPGSYKFVISDKASSHNFTLERESGGKFEKHITATSFRGTKSATITLKRGEWKYYCSVHEATMHGSFDVK
jgi:plastocyanin